MTPLSQLLRESSRPEHTDAETRPFVTMLMGGELSVEHYVAYMMNLAPVYSALEQRTHLGEPFPGTNGLWDDALDRTNSIQHDLTELGVANGDESSVTPESREYAEYLVSLTGRSDLRLIAHHYTRYLGDLSGGQAIGALIARHYGLSPEQLTFYAFAGIENVVRYKESYRDTLDQIPMSETERDDLVIEVKRAFRFNQAIFESLGNRLVAA